MKQFDEADAVEAKLKQLQFNLRRERARQHLPQTIKDLDYLTHSDLVELYNALVVKLMSPQ